MTDTGTPKSAAGRHHKTKEERKKELEQKLEQINQEARQKANALKAKIARLDQADRALDTRRKILLGAFLANAWENHKPATKEELAKFLTKETDKVLLEQYLNG